jgi:hypothetical protein
VGRSEQLVKSRRHGSRYAFAGDRSPVPAWRSATSRQHTFTHPYGYQYAATHRHGYQHTLTYPYGYQHAGTYQHSYQYAFSFAYPHRY